MELLGFPSDVRAQVQKQASISLCSNTIGKSAFGLKRIELMAAIGQLTVGLMVNPPKAGEPSYEQYCQERDAILTSLKRRAKKLADALNSFVS
jgi:alanine transaminase